MSKKILITGGSGLVGSRLSQGLAEKGHVVSHLSRRVTGAEPFSTFKWDINQRYIDEKAFEDVSVIIHLAGAGVADKRWNDARKKQILDSRVKSTELLHSYTTKLGLQLDQYITASAVGLYGDTKDESASEDYPPANGFLAEVVKEWERSADRFQSSTKVSKVRVGVVLSAKAGALKEIAKPIRLYAGAVLGSGSQYLSWIHEQDLAKIFVYILENQLEGVFNAVAPNPITNAQLTRAIASVLKKPLWLPNVPPFALKLLVGEIADMLLTGTRVSSKKIEDAGFNFDFTDVKSAIADLLL